MHRETSDGGGSADGSGRVCIRILGGHHRCRRRCEHRTDGNDVPLHPYKSAGLQEGGVMRFACLCMSAYESTEVGGSMIGA